MTTMYCAGLNSQGFGGYNAHPGSANYIVQVPFREAVTSPPCCPLHGAPYLTLGGYRLARVLRRFSESGRITGDCRVSYGFEQAAFCANHDWGGRASECRDDRCPHQGIAAWIARRHEQPVLSELGAG